MDNKTIALIGALLVLGVAIYGMATGNLPGVDSLGGGGEDGGGEAVNNGGAGNDDGGPPVGTGPDDSGGGSGGGGDNGGGNETEVATNETGNVTAPEPEPLPIVCEDQGGDFSSRDLESPSSDPLNTRLAESIIHDRLNELRAFRGDALVDPLKCDPVLREVARDHGRLILIQEGARGSNYVSSDYQDSQKRIRGLGGDIEIQDNIGEMSADDVEINETRLYEREGKSVCENPSLEYGTFAYDINIEEGGSDFAAADFAGDQSLSKIDDEEELARDVRRTVLDSIGALTDEGKVRQGIGVTIDRRTNEVVVTRILCGPRGEQTQGQNQ